MENTRTNQMRANAIVCWLMGIVLVLFYTWYAITPIAYFDNLDIFLSELGARRLKEGLMPSVDFYTPSGLFVYALFGAVNWINPAGAQSLASLPFSVLFILLLYRLRYRISTVFMFMLCAMWGIFVLYSYTPFVIRDPITPFNYYNDILLAIWILAMMTMVMFMRNNYSAKLWHYLLLIGFTFFTFFYKLPAVIIPLSVWGFLFLYDKNNRWQNGIWSLCLLCVLCILLYVLSPPYLLAYIEDVSIASRGGNTHARIEYILKGIIAGNILVYVMCAILYKKKNAYLNIKFFLLVNIIIGGMLLIHISSGYLFVYREARIITALTGLGVCVYLLQACFSPSPPIVRKKLHQCFDWFVCGFILLCLADISYRLVNREVHEMKIARLEYYDYAGGGRGLHYKKILSYYYTGFVDILAQNIIPKHATIAIAQVVNLADIWFNQTPSKYPDFINWNVSFSSDYPPHGDDVLRGMSYVAIASSNLDTCDPKGCDSGWTKSFLTVYGDYLHQHFTPVYTNNAFVLYQRKVDVQRQGARL